MIEQLDRGRVISAPTRAQRVEADTGLGEHAQRERAAIAALWAWRPAFVLEQTGCSAADAFRAVEQTDRSTP